MRWDFKMIKKLFIGLDPDLTNLTAAIITADKIPLAVFMRRNKSTATDDIKIADAARCAYNLMEDVKTFIAIIVKDLDQDCTLTTVVESQNIMQAIKMREQHKHIRLEDIRKLAQVAGQLMGAFSYLSDKMILVQPIHWKGTKGKPICHSRTYTALNLTPDPEKRVLPIYPLNKDELCQHSAEKINLGDFMDINDSLGLAVYGAKKNL